MNIIGINAHHADASAAIFCDGKLIAAIEEERFSRIKHQAGFPGQALKFCLQEAGLQVNDIDIIAIGRNPYAKLYKKVLFALQNPLNKGFLGRLVNTNNIINISTPLAHILGCNESIVKKKLKFVEHHRCHLASSFFASPYEHAACISIDGSGDFTTAMFAKGIQNKIVPFHSIDFPHSIGIFYSAFTQFLGFANYGDEYKVMGLAAHGNPLLTNEVGELINLVGDGNIKLNLKYFNNPAKGILSYNEKKQPIVEQLFNENFIKKFGLPRKAGEAITDLHKNIAASVQAVTEQAIFHLLNYAYEKTKLKNLCLAGGVIQNSVANGKIRANTGFESSYIPPAAHDAGISIGAAMYIQHQELNLPRQQVTPAYTGTSYSIKEIAEFLNGHKIAHKIYEADELYDTIANELVAGKVVGWFNGKSEFGPRALGARSILFDPRNPDAVSILNEKIKRREGFRPFAPSILVEHINEYFEAADETPYMEKVYKIKPNKQPQIPAVVHVDGSGRLQTVAEKTSPSFYKLIHTFKQKTGIPILLNTSFNENEPIVNTLQDALNCFRRTGMDILVLENAVIRRY